ncbi:MAG TPA: HXXEE domain-containing protein [Longimicrobium sp.]|jgi:hypothetical protein
MHPSPEDSAADRVAAGVLVAATCAAELAAMGRAVVVLAAALAASYAVWAARTEWGPPRRMLPAYTAAVLVQCVHLAEEFRTGFHARFPPLLGAQPWPAGRFLAFNFAWLAVFALAGIGLARGKRLAYLVALFLALGGGIGNGLGHLGLALRAGGYFPGAYTGALALVAGSMLMYRLMRPTPRAVPAV